MSNYYEYESGGQMGPGPGMPMQGMPMHPGMPMQRGYGGFGNRFGMRGSRYGSETKPFYLTSEFVVSLVASIAIAITAASSTAFGAWRAWILVTAIVAAYTVSRGIAKCGTRSQAVDPRENLELSWRRGERQEHQHQHPGTPPGYAEAPTAQYEASQYGPPA